jgi:hypothetical protein
MFYDFSEPYLRNYGLLSLLLWSELFGIRMFS